MKLPTHGSNGIAIDEFGNATVTGLTLSSNFPTLNGFATDLANSDGFVTKLNATGTALLYSTYLGLSNYSRFYAGLSHIMVALIFFQFTAILIILGAELNRGIMELKKMQVRK